MNDGLTDEDRQRLARRIDCPVPWCEGRWIDHGGDGSGPDDWEHEDGDGIALTPDARLGRWQVGASPVEWSLYLDTDAGTVNLGTALDPRQLAERLRTIATAIDGASS